MPIDAESLACTHEMNRITREHNRIAHRNKPNSSKRHYNMSLARLDEHLTSSNLYPDHVVIIYRYNIPPCASQTFANVLGTLGFRRDSRHHGSGFSPCFR